MLAHILFLLLLLASAYGQTGSGDLGGFASTGGFTDFTDFNGYVADFNDVNNKQQLQTYLTAINYDPFSVPWALDNQYDSITLLVQVNRIGSYVQTAPKFFIDMDIYVSWVDVINFNMTKILAKLKEKDSSGLSNPVLLDLKNGSSLVYDSFRPRTLWYPSISCPRMRNMEQTDMEEVQLSTTLSMTFDNGLNSVTPTFTFYRRIVGDVSCAMDFSDYPFDKHTCQIPLQFREFDKLKMRTKFRAPSGSTMLNAMIASFSFNSNFTQKVPQFSRTSRDLVENAIPAVSVVVTLQRKSESYAVTQFLPLTIVTICGISSVFIDVNVAPARAGVGITSILSLVALSFVFTKDLPESPNLTFTSIYNIICLFFAFASLLIFALVHTVKLIEGAPAPAPPPPPPPPPKVLPEPAAGEPAAGSPGHQIIEVQGPGNEPPKSVPPPKPKAKIQKWQIIDKFFKYFMPVAYGIFIVVFFPVVVAKNK